MITNSSISVYVQFVNRCVKNNNYSSELYSKQKSNNKLLVANNEFVDVSQFISSLIHFLKYIVNQVHLHNTALYSIIHEIDKCNGHMSVSMKKQTSTCVISGKQLLYPSVLLINNKRFTVDRQYVKFAKMFYSLRYIFPMVTTALESMSEQKIVEIINQSCTNLQAMVQSLEPQPSQLFPEQLTASAAPSALRNPQTGQGIGPQTGPGIGPGIGPDSQLQESQQLTKKRRVCESSVEH